MVVLDATALGLLLHPGSRPPNDPVTGEPVSRCGERYRYLEQTLQRERETIIVPTPALAEFLVLAGDGAADMLATISRSGRFKIGEFEARAAVEVAAMTRDAVRAGDKKSGSAEPYQKIKVDRQIIAIARVMGARAIYSDDKNLNRFAALLGMKVIRSAELALPPEETPNLFTALDAEAEARKEAQGES